MIQRIWASIPSWLKNRYSLTILVFLVWMLFFDQNDIISQIELKQQLNSVENKREYYKTQIKETRSDLENLLNDNEKLERFARERYLMKKPNEEIFVIVDEEK
ncbi:MAG: septum formation initiator family protein [Salibacter sp.]|uniref:FtsB family cell division protein n=1 Tax=Salibacter sp. TaxID=2010995 RepID=UPI00286FFCFC|nr:septum formation initiator family protein [Salibacter sp.]MDR9399125.1 septum formation initiator family protein [Salibacter sp.]